MRVASGDGVLVKNPKNQFEVRLIGNVDYGICTYPIRRISQYVPFGSYLTSPRCSFPDTVLESTLDDLMIYARNGIMLLIEAKHDKNMLTDSLPEAY